MKQMKFFFLALMAVVMSVSVTSCMNGDENTIVRIDGIITLKSNFMQHEFQGIGSETTFVANNHVESLASAQSGDIIFLLSQYDSKTQAVDQNTSKIYVDVNYAFKLNSNVNANFYEKQDEVGYLANRTIIPLSNYQGASPFMYGSDWVIIPIPYYMEKYENLSQHSFTLAYFEDEEVKNSTLRLHLYHNSSEEISKETAINVNYNSYESHKAFNINGLISRFKSNNEGKAPQKIVIVTQEASKAVEIKEGATGYNERDYTVENYTVK